MPPAYFPLCTVFPLLLLSNFAVDYCIALIVCFACYILPIALRMFPLAYCLSPVVSCLLPPAYYLLPTVSRLLLLVYFSCCRFPVL